jgi:hypothetical protein
LTDPFINTIKFLINYYQIPPDRWFNHIYFVLSVIIPSMI